MKYFFSTCLLLLVTTLTNAQVGIGTSNVNTSARLQVDATNKGFLPPRVTLTGTADASTILTPATGLLVYNTATAGTSPSNVTPGFYYYDGAKWQRIINQQPDATVSFNTADPNTGSPTFTPSNAASTDFIYVSSVNNSQWTWNGSVYVTYTPPASTPWMLSGGTSDAGSNKTGAIYRTGRVGIGTNAPSARLDIRTSPASTTDPGEGYLGVGTAASTAASAAGAGAVRYSTSSGGVLEYSNGSVWNTLSSSVQRANLYATRLSSSVFTVNGNTSDNTFGSFTSSSGAGVTNFNSSTGVYTAPRSGLYNVSAGMSFKMLAASPSGVFHFLVMKGGISGTEVCNQALPINYPINSILSANISCSVPLDAGETIQIKYHNWTGTQIEVSLSPSFQGRYYFTVTEN